MKRKNVDAEQPPSILDLSDRQTAEGASVGKTGELPKVAGESIEGATHAGPAKADAAPAAPVFGFRKKSMWGF